MVNTLFNKRAVNLSKALLVAYFALFPFGQLTRIGVNLFSLPLAFNVSDIVSGLFIIPYLLGVKDKSPITKYYSNLLIYFAFSYLVSLFVFKDIRVLAGFFYLLRFGSYYFMSRVVSGLYIYKLLAKKSLIILLKYAFITTLFFAFYQYLFLPDLRPLKYLGWDDHLYRLTGAFLDPGFAGIILILGFLFFLIEFFQKKIKMDLIISLLALIALLLTYSRASYVAFSVGVIYLIVVTKQKLAKVLIILVLIAIPFLPRPSSEGVKLERVFSIVSRVGSYKQALSVVSQNPLFGVGFNNYCLATNSKFFSRSCSSSDASLLTIFATTGILGLIFYLYFWFSVFKSTNSNKYGLILRVSLITLLTHSLFVNSLFYPWVLGWFSILAAMGINKTTD